jgi:predicted membrane channel-forming protein YqfA (hemolysin III family)
LHHRQSAWKDQGASAWASLMQNQHKETTMETIHIIGFIGALISLYFCAVLMSSNRSTQMAYQLSSFFLSHAAGLQGYRSAWAKTRKACAKAAAFAEESRAQEKETRQHREKAMEAAQLQFERSILN